MTKETLTPSAKEREASKTDAQRAEDIAYTINHALACTATDFIDPYFGNMTQKWLGKRFSIGCGHDHRNDKPHTHGHEHHGPPCAHDHKHDHVPNTSHLGHWWIGEVVGDFGAVPLTIGLQRYFPNFMNGLRKVMEPVFGKFFRKGAERASKRWAEARRLDIHSQEYKDYEEAMYRNEMDHLPQALVWTASSIAINLTTQRVLGNKAPIWQLAAGKAVGASISAGFVVGARGLAPGTAEKWDKVTSETLLLPATKAVGKLFGVHDEDVERMAAKEMEPGESWAERARDSGPKVGR